MGSTGPPLLLSSGRSFGGKCSDIGKVCTATQSMGGAMECPQRDENACSNAKGANNSCDGTNGCGCSSVQMPVTPKLGSNVDASKGWPMEGGTSGASISDVAAIYALCA